MHVNEENFETDAYFVEHILEAPDYKKLIIFMHFQMIS